MNDRFILLRDYGLVIHWIDQLQPKLRTCMSFAEGDKILASEKRLARLNLGNLSGGFALIGIGYLFSLIAFILEVFHSRLV